jgi:DNA-directed RNA polymerase subunit RPC12/RpoP
MVGRAGMSETFTCETCERTVGRAEAIRSETFGDLDPTKWQTLCCPDCGSRLKTVFVGTE